MAKKSSQTTNNGSEAVLYQADDGKFQLLLKLENESVWLTLNQIVELYKSSKPNISMHIRNILQENELEEWATVKQNLTVQIENGKQVHRKLTYYNLEMILSVGYRVRSIRGTQFRMWATQHLSEYLIKGFVLDDERLKGSNRITDYFDELLARIRDIRASERRMYLRVREIFAMAGDYNPSLHETTKFYSIIQNKLHFAATGLTAAEIIKSRANHALQNMGLTNWKEGEVRKTDVTIAKNYLQENEIDELNRIVVMWLDFAEDQARRRKQVFMKDWELKLDEFLYFNERKVLPNAGKISKAIADEHAQSEYEEFAQVRREYKEEIGEAENIKQLEETARQFDKQPNK
jgi:hypothetical protein